MVCSLEQQTELTLAEVPIMKFNHPQATINSRIQAQCEGFNVNLLKNSTFGQLQKVREGRVVLNIGGQCFHTSMVTLGGEPNSRFIIS